MNNYNYLINIMSNELKLDLLKEKGKSLLRVIIGIIFFLIVIAWIISKMIGKEGVKPFEWILYGLFALNGIVQFVEGLGYPFESLFGKAYIWINDEFISLKASVFAKKQFVNWNDIQIIDYKLNKFIIEKTDNTILIIDLSKFEYIVNMEIKKVIFGIAQEKNVQSNF